MGKQVSSAVEDQNSGLGEFRLRARVVNGVTFIRLRGFSPLMAFLTACVLGSLAIAAGYPIYTLISGQPRVPSPILAAAIAAVILAAVLSAARRVQRGRTGMDDLIIDDKASALALPRSFGRRGETVIDFEQISAIQPACYQEKLLWRSDPKTHWVKLHRLPHIERNRIGHRDHEIYLVLVCWCDDSGVEREDPIVSHSVREWAIGFAFWLEQRVGIEPAGEAEGVDA